MCKELFKRIDSVIRSERLYANVDLMHAGGLSFPQYINNIRVKEAYELITHHPEMSITEIAFEVGFTPPNLRDQFKRHYGMTPTKYRTHLV